MVDSEDILEVPLRPLVWMGDSRKNIRAFPQEVRAAGGLCVATSAGRRNTTGCQAF